MGFATHLGPWLLGTVKNTTGTTAGTLRNTGATIVAQNTAIAFGDAAGSTAAVLPAGALITSMQIITTTGFSGGTSPTITLSIGGVAVTSALTAPAAAGVTAFTVATTGAPLVVNVGATDALLTYTIAGTPTGGAGTIVVAYVVRNSDGSSYPSAFQN